MNSFLIIAVTVVFSLAVAKAGLPGGYSPVGPDDEQDVDQCRAKIISDLQKQESSANDGYEVIATVQKETVEKQVVNGMNYRFRITVLFTFNCSSKGKCVAKNGESKSCSATVFKDLGTNEPLTYAADQEAKCN